MKFLAGLGATIADSFQRFLAPVLRAIFGQIRWTPPAWLPRAGAKLRAWCGRAIDWLAARRAAYPVRFWLEASVILLFIIGSYAGWQWYEHLPTPYYLQVSVSRSNPTPLEPDAIPDPVNVQFSGSAAKLGAIGKNVTSGITVTPALEGVWKWVGDSQLVFTPRHDWPISQDYTIKLDRKLFPSHVLLKDYTYSFRSPDFGASIQDEEFYEDPTNPKIKQVVATVSFTHPVDKADFEKRISFRMRVEPVKNFDSIEAKSFGFKVTYDAVGGKAFIHSDPFGIPNDEGAMLLLIAKGVRSSRGGPGTEETLERTVNIPGIQSYFRIQSVTSNEVANDRDEMERIVTIEASAPMRQSDLARSISVVLLPKDKPAIGDENLAKDYEWSNALEVVPDVMKLVTPVPIEWIPTEREFMPAQSFKFTADTGRFLMVTVRQGLKSFGDYPLAKDYSEVVEAPAFPPAAKIISEGSVLSLSGEKKISILTRNIPAIQIEVSRLLPGTVSHLVSQTQGNFSNPTFWGQYNSQSLGFDDLSEVVSEVRKLPADSSGKNQYSVFDFAPLLSSGALPHGLFWLKIQAWDPVNNVPLGTQVTPVQSSPMAAGAYRRRRSYWVAVQPVTQVTGQASASDERLILLTDLGLVVKDSADGSHDVFVQSIHSGEPLADVAIDMLGKNGLPIFSRKTDADGRATFPTLQGFQAREDADGVRRPERRRLFFPPVPTQRSTA